ncbi:MAG: DUF2784 domain-containing protein [Azoarcus sp.]|nr:DUF2784 domain-containing protein [Azoarcus sp.]
MLFRFAADTVLVLHLAFIVFVVLGGILCFRWRWMPLVHLPAAGWGVFIELTGGICPLTPLENLLRLRAGQSGYAGGFIEHYLLGLIYPAGLTRDWQFILAAIVILANIAIYAGLVIRRRRDRGRTPTRPVPPA